jgi:hypothetical protein
MKQSGQEFSAETIQWIGATIEAEPGLSRGELSRRVCEKLSWRTRTGQLKQMSCRVALLKLHRQGHLSLPEGGKKPGTGRKQEPGAVDIPAIECGLSELGQVELVRIGINDRKLSGIWNSLMQHHHYLGSGPLCGAQVRYLIRCREHGWLGGLSFSAAAWRLEARDAWIGWGEAAQAEHLEKLLCNSRFLICPQVRVAHLASQVLGLAVKQVAVDWQELYGIEPVLVETFVEAERFLGTSYRAANWIHIGRTKGRGRQDRQNLRKQSVKDIYVYPLRRNARERLCDGHARPGTESRMPPQDWAEEEFGGAQLGDERRVKRLVRIARDFFARPQANVPQACQSRAKTKAAYRFFEDNNNRMEKVLTAHYESTANRMAQEKVVLAAQDTTTLNYSTHPATQGLGLIASRQESVIGLIVHDTMAFSTEGTPLGLIDVQCWARDAEDFGKKHLRHTLPIEQKESNKWLKSFRALAALQGGCPDTVLVSVGDREADIYEFFIEAQQNGNGAQVLVRAERDRLLADGQGHLWEYVGSRPVSGIQTIQVPRRGTRPARQAALEVRYAQVRLQPPRRKRELEDVAVWAVLAREVDYAEGVEPLEWMLLTTLEVNSFESATEKLRWYCGRWGIEVYHRTLKSGCRIEQRQLGSADSIQACLAIDMVVAWRIYHLTKLGREVPEVDCTVFFEEAEWKALVAYKTQNPLPPAKPPTLREAIRMVASLGGFLGRKSDGEPGTQTLWLGLQRLDDLAAMWKITMPGTARNNDMSLVSRHKYG